MSNYDPALAAGSEPYVPVTRSAGLVVFGVLQLLIGLVCALLLLASATAKAYYSHQVGGPSPAQNMIPAIFMYAIATVLFVALGVGSIRHRRWSVALTLATAWAWLVMGIIAVAFMVVLVPHVLDAMQTRSAVMAGVLVFLFLLFAALPASFVLFYRRTAVRVAAAAADTKPRRWTDRTNTPTLAIASTLAFVGVTFLANLSTDVLLLFGFLLTGVTATVTVLALSGFLLFLSVQTYFQRPAAWWSLIFLHVLSGVAGAVSIVRFDPVKAAQTMNLPGAQARQFGQLASALHSPATIALMVLTWGGLMAFLIFARRYFGQAETRTALSPVNPS